MSLEKKYEYIDKYQKENIRRVVVKFNRKKERDVAMLEHLEKQDSIQGYIKDLISADMEK